jgi:hypothetical protein
MGCGGTGKIIVEQDIYRSWNGSPLVKQRGDVAYPCEGCDECPTDSRVVVDDQPKEGEDG